MEHKIGEEFNVILRIKPKEGRGGDYDCSRCAMGSVCSGTHNSVSPCANKDRQDGIDVYFDSVSVKDEKEMKQLENMPEENIKNTTTNDSLDLTKILKNCPAGFPLYYSVGRYVEFNRIEDGKVIIDVYVQNHTEPLALRSDGRMFEDGDCLIFPSKDQRDWNKFEAPWYRNRNNDGILKIKLNIEEQIKWYGTFLYYADLYPNESIECVIKLTNERVYGDKNKQ